MLYGVLKRAGRPDPVAVSQARFAPLRARLGDAAGTLGYLCDLPPGTEFDKRFGEAQFALAPVLLSSGPKFSAGLSGRDALVVGDFSGASGLAAARARGLSVAADFGQGLFLLVPGGK